MKLSNNSFFVILVFAILKFRNIDRSIFRRFEIFTPNPNYIFCDSVLFEILFCIANQNQI